MAVGAGSPGGRVVAFAGPGTPAPTTVPLCGLPAVWWSLGTAFAVPVNRYSPEFETVQSGHHSQQGRRFGVDLVQLSTNLEFLIVDQIRASIGSNACERGIQFAEDVLNPAVDLFVGSCRREVLSRFLLTFCIQLGGLLAMRP